MPAAHCCARAFNSVSITLSRFLRATRLKSMLQEYLGQGCLVVHQLGPCQSSDAEEARLHCSPIPQLIPLCLLRCTRDLCSRQAGNREPADSG